MVPIFSGVPCRTALALGEPVGDDLDAAIEARAQKQAYFDALDANVPVVQELDSTRTKITDAVFYWFAERRIFCGKDQQGKSEKTIRAYQYRLGIPVISGAGHI